jgi:hypothetical protein
MRSIREVPPARKAASAFARTAATAASVSVTLR